MAWTNLGGGDHGGANWTPANGTSIAGDHINIGTFTVAAGATIYVHPYSGANYGELKIEAQDIVIAGTLDAKGAGYGGGGGGGGGAGANGGWEDTTTLGGVAGTGSYGGSNGGAGENTSGPWATTGGDGGNGGAGGGPYGGAATVGGAGGANHTAGSTPTVLGMQGGYRGSTINGDNSTNEAIYMGGGGAGGGAGGGGGAGDDG